MAQRMRSSLKCCCCTWKSRLGGMLIRLDFIKLETDHLVFFLGTGAGFFQQLKLDIFRDAEAEEFFKKSNKWRLFLYCFAFWQGSLDPQNYELAP